jgi:hypothetical protein
MKKFANFGVSWSLWVGLDREQQLKDGETNMAFSSHLRVFSLYRDKIEGLKGTDT